MKTLRGKEMCYKLIKKLDAIDKRYISSSEYLVLLRLIIYGDSDTGLNIRPSINTVAKALKMTAKTISKIIQNLIRKGFLILVRNYSSVLHAANEYQANMVLIEGLSKGYMIGDPDVDKSYDKATSPVEVMGGGTVEITGGGTVEITNNLHLTPTFRNNTNTVGEQIPVDNYANLYKNGINEDRDRIFEKPKKIELRYLMFNDAVQALLAENLKHLERQKVA
jgi:hypothetical protein